VKWITNTEPKSDYKAETIKKERKNLVKEAKDKARNIIRATENTGAVCIVCGNIIKKGQPIRIMPKDGSCQEDRLYHLKTCSPGSDNWKAFKADGKKTPKRSFQWQQLSFKWNRVKA
jgi:hypothetical protein